MLKTCRALYDDACLPRTGQTEPANREQQLFLRFKADESSQAVTEKPRLMNPEDKMKDNRFTITNPITLLAVPASCYCGRWFPAYQERDAPTAAVRFTDVTTLRYPFHAQRGRTGKKWLPETMGSGVAFFDADGDGKPIFCCSTAATGFRTDATRPQRSIAIR